MTVANKIDSNSTGLSIAEETSPKVLPGTPVWVPLEPNSYGEFGGEITTVARNPINANRQRQKGVVVDVDASASFPTDITTSNMEHLLQGFLFADLRRKGEAKNAIGISTMTLSATATGSLFTRVGGTVSMSDEFAADDLVFVSGFTNAANNGLFKVDAVTAATISVFEADGAETAVVLVDEAATSAASIVRVGVESAIGDLDVDMTGSRPALTSTALDFTDLDLVVGEFVYVGGDETLTTFGTTGNAGFCRVRSVTATRLEFDKTQATMVTEANTTLFVHIYFGRVLKNETGTDIVRRTYQLERTLGKADTTDTYDQAEYIEGAAPNEATFNISRAAKAEVDLAYVGMDHTFKNGTVGPKSGTRPSLVVQDAFNTSSDLSVIKLAVHSETSANPTDLFAFAQELTLAINNNQTPNKALGVTGAFDVTAGTFEVGGNVTAVFSDVAAIEAVRNNSDITLHAHLVKSNAGVTIDLPLITLGDGRANVEQDAEITLPLSTEAASGAKIDTDMDHTMLMVFWDYLPDAADA